MYRQMWQLLSGVAVMFDFFQTIITWQFIVVTLMHSKVSDILESISGSSSSLSHKRRQSIENQQCTVENHVTEPAL
jgi:hypothetical protein